MTSSKQRISTIAFALITLALVAGCHKNKPIASPPLPPSLNGPPSPTATITAVPDTIQPGQTSTLTWSTVGASDVTLNNAPVQANGSQSVSPTVTTTYTLIARGDGGSTTSSATVTIGGTTTQSNAVDTSNMTNDQIFHSQVPDIFYDYDSYDIRPDAQTAVAKAVRFLNANQQIRVLIGGYCDDRGSTEYNLALGASRADAAKDALVKGGVSATRIRTVSYGKEKPFCTEENEECWQQNRRAAFSVDK